MVVLLAGSLAGFALDFGLRVVSGKTASMRTSSAVTLYGGLLVSGTGQGCGYWSVEAANAAKADTGKALGTAIVDRLQGRPLSHWAGVVACKMPPVVLPPPYALYWLVEAPNVRASIDRRADRERIQADYLRVLIVERIAYGGLTLAILAATVLVPRPLRPRRKPLLWLAPAWVLAFWAVHSVFEIQGRYFLPMLLLAPLLAALSIGAVTGHAMRRQHRIGESKHGPAGHPREVQ